MAKFVLSFMVSLLATNALAQGRPLPQCPQGSKPAITCAITNAGWTDIARLFCKKDQDYTFIDYMINDAFLTGVTGNAVVVQQSPSTLILRLTSKKGSNSRTLTYQLNQSGNGNARYEGSEYWYNCDTLASK